LLRPILLKKNKIINGSCLHTSMKNIKIVNLKISYKNFIIKKIKNRYFIHIQY
jgi:hypothetical protein